jgi:hypothetical protein
MPSYCPGLLICFFSTVVPCLDIEGIGSYTPEGLLTTCSFDYLDTSSSNYWFIMIYAIVSLKSFQFSPSAKLSFFPQAAYFLPLTIIAYCYFHILHVVLSAQKIQSSKEKNKTEVRLAGIVMGIVGLVSQIRSFELIQGGRSRNVNIVCRCTTEDVVLEVSSAWTLKIEQIKRKT